MLLSIIPVIGLRYDHIIYTYIIICVEQCNPSELSLLVIPVNINNNHWILCVSDKKMSLDPE